MLFPSLQGKPYGHVNLNLEAQSWVARQLPAAADLLDPETCTRMVRELHEELGLAFSYGGWLEDRSYLWSGSYLDEKGTYTHLGIDVNAPAGTEIAAAFDCEVVYTEVDENVGGWGPMLIARFGASDPFYLLHAHLDGLHGLKVGDRIAWGQIFAAVGEAPQNGNWFPHLHLQVLTDETFHEFQRHGSWPTLDGYGHEKDRGRDARRFPDPLQFVSLT